MDWLDKRAELAAKLGRDPDLNELVILARTHTPTEAELAAQRHNFVRGEIGMGGDRDEAAYRAAVERGDGPEIARLDAAAAARMARFDRSLK